MALVKWYDDRPVVMTSNFVGVGRMSGDQVDQLLSLYRTEYLVEQSGLRMTTHAFDMAVVNSVANELVWRHMECRVVWAQKSLRNLSF